jgi:hypothetical protein
VPKLTPASCAAFSSGDMVEINAPILSFFICLSAFIPYCGNCSTPPGILHAIDVYMNVRNLNTKSLLPQVLTPFMEGGMPRVSGRGDCHMVTTS